jgi:uridine kinase
MREDGFVPNAAKYRGNTAKGQMIDEVVKKILAMQKEMPAVQSVLVGISGIDACGKGYITEKVASELNESRLNVAIINVDGWLNLPPSRFAPDNPGQHFYENALRLDQMFDQLVLPLKANRSVRLAAEIADETAATFARHVYAYRDIDVILLEGIFIFKLAFVDYFDLRIWIDCSFDIAMERAVNRSQEGLSAAQTIEAYNNIYVPAQRIHFENDNPRNAADLIVANN